MNTATFKYLFIALFYLIGRIGFTSSPDVFNKTRPNRHINNTQLPQALVILNVTSISAQKFEAKLLPQHNSKNYIFYYQFPIDNFYALGLANSISYKGIHIMPPPLLA